MALSATCLWASLNDLKPWLNFAATDVQHDAMLEVWANAVTEQVEREIKIEPASNHLGLIFPLDVSFRVLFPWINLEAQLRYEFQYLGILRHYEGTGLAGFIGYHGPQLLCSYYF